MSRYRPTLEEINATRLQRETLAAKFVIVKTAPKATLQH